MKILNNSISAQRLAYDERLRLYMLNILGYMSLALLVTGIVSYYTFELRVIDYFIAKNEDSYYGMSILGWVVALSPLAFVIFFVGKIRSMGLNAARISLLIYSTLVGMSLSSIFLVYFTIDITRAFFITAATFLSMCIYGYTIKRDLTSIGSFMLMGLIGVVIASLSNLFLKSPALYFAVSAASVLIFTGLTAYDVQRLKEIFDSAQVSERERNKIAIIGALSLYTDFINLFLAILRFSDKKEWK